MRPNGPFCTESLPYPNPTRTVPGSVTLAPASSTVTSYSPTGRCTTRNSPCCPERARSESSVSVSRTTTRAPATGTPAALSTRPPIAPSVPLCAPATKTRPTQATDRAATQRKHPRPSPMTIDPRSKKTQDRTKRLGSSQPKPTYPTSRALQNNLRDRDTTRSPARPVHNGQSKSGDITTSIQTASACDNQPKTNRLFPIWEGRPSHLFLSGHPELSEPKKRAAAEATAQYAPGLVTQQSRD